MNNLALLFDLPLKLFDFGDLESTFAPNNCQKHLESICLNVISSCLTSHQSQMNLIFRKSLTSERYNPWTLKWMLGVYKIVQSEMASSCLQVCCCQKVHDIANKLNAWPQETSMLKVQPSRVVSGHSHFRSRSILCA